MRVAEATTVARQWVETEAVNIDGFAGAYLSGSATWLPGDADLPVSSDVDIHVVIDAPKPPRKLGKFLYEGALLEVAFDSPDRLRSADAVLSDYHLAPAFRVPTVLADPKGQLTALYEAVAPRFSERRWVTERCAHARRNALGNLARMKDAATLHDRVTCWAFGAGITTHVLLTAGLKNPTVRRRYAATRELLGDYHLLDLHESLLDTLGCADMTRETVEGHLAALTEVFDTAKTVLKTPYVFGEDISDTGRPVAIGGSRELIDRGLHREAVFWMIATFSRCQAVLDADALPAVRYDATERYWELLRDLGIHSPAHLDQRCEQVERQLPAVWAAAMAIIEANPGVR